MNPEHLKKGSYAFPGERRVKKRRDFLRVQTQGRRLRANNFLLLYLPLSPTSGQLSRIGITVTVKIHKRAVQRNLLKRRVREVYRQTLPRFVRHSEMVIIALHDSTELDFRSIRSQLLYLWAKAGLLPERKPRIR